MYTIKERTDIPLIRIENLLPDWMVDDTLDLTANLKDRFSSPGWSNGRGGQITNRRERKSLCSAKDLWIPISQAKDSSTVDHPSMQVPWVPPLLYELVERHFFQHGILDYCRNAKNSIFRLLPTQDADGRIHIISYGNGGYYNWHKDNSISEGAYLYGESPARNMMFTFNLSLCKEPSGFEGGNLLFMDGDKVVQEPFAHNSMTIFPCTVSHAVETVRFNESENWDNRRISLQFWMAGNRIFANKQTTRWV